MTEEKHDNLSKALLFSLLVAIGGGAVWGILYSVGYFVSIVAYGTAYLMFTIYLKHAKLSKITFIWTLVWIIVINTIASVFSIVMSVASENNVTIGAAFEAFILVFDEVAGMFFLDMGLGAIFAVLGVVSYYGNYKRKLANVQKYEEYKTQTEEDTQKPSDVEEKLQAVEEALKNGDITEEEYKKQREDILKDL